MSAPASLKKLAPKLEPSAPPAVVARALAHVAAHGQAARGLVPQVLALLRRPETAEPAANTLLSLSPLPPDRLAEVAELASTSATPAVRVAAASVLGAFGPASVGTVPLLERVLAETGSPRAWTTLLAIDPDHPAANDALIADWRRSGLDWIGALLHAPRVSDAFWAAVEHAIVDHDDLGGWTALRVRYDAPERILGIVRRAVGGSDLVSGLATSRNGTFARRTLARLAAAAPGVLDADVVEALFQRAETLAREERVGDLDELGVLVGGLIVAGSPRDRVEALVLATLHLARAAYAAYEGAVQRLVANLAEGLAQAEDVGSDEVLEQLVTWDREPEVGRIVSRVLEARKRHRLGVGQFWRPEPELPPLSPPPTPRAVLATASELPGIAARVAEGYTAYRMDPALDPTEAIDVLFHRLCAARVQLLRYDGLHPKLPILGGWVLGDLVVRAYGWRWSWVDRKATPEEKLLASIFGRPWDPDPAVLSPSGRQAIELEAAIVHQLRYLSGLGLLFDEIGYGLRGGTPTRPAWFVEA